jgi:hypothetical protein
MTACRALAGTRALGSEPHALEGPVVIPTPPSTSLLCHGVYDANGRGVVPPGAFEFQVADDTGTVWNFSVYIPDFQNPLANGDIISVTSSVNAEGYIGPAIVNLTVRDANGALLFYVGDGHNPADLTLPDGLTLSLSAPVCHAQSNCGSWSDHPFVVYGSDSSVEVPYLGSATLGAYRLVHGGGEIQDSGGIICPDWAVAHVALGISPLD